MMELNMYFLAIVIMLSLSGSTVYYWVKYTIEKNKKYIEIPLNEVLIAARDIEDEFDKLSLNTAHIRKEVNLSKIDEMKLALYESWLKDELIRVNQTILNKLQHDIK